MVIVMVIVAVRVMVRVGYRWVEFELLFINN